MDRLLYISMTGATEVLKAQAAVSNNLANVSTTGFKADFNQFRSMPVYGETHPSRAYAMSERPGIDFRAGSFMTTGRELDMAVQNEGWIAVRDAQGKEAYTKAGDMRLTVNGFLEIGSGYQVMGDGGPLAIPPAEKVEIGHDGTVSIRPLGSQANALAQIDRIKLVNPPAESLEKGADGLFRPADQNTKVQADASIRLISGVLESSNVNPVEQMVQMIDLSRRFEMQVKMMQMAEKNDESAASLMRMS